jgi:hypothetical protein
MIGVGKMRAERTTSFDRAFVLRPEVISRIFETVKESCGVPEIKVECAGGISLAPASTGELLTIPNLGDYKIKSVRIQRWGGIDVSVTFSLGAYQPPIKLYVAGSDEEVIRIHEMLRREILQATSGYLSYFLHAAFGEETQYFPMALLFVIAAMTVAICSGFLRPDRFGFLEFMLCSYAIIVGAGVTGVLLSRMLSAKVYPKGVFLIGAGAQEHESIKFRRQQLSIWTLVAALVAAGVFAIFEHWFRF